MVINTFSTAYLLLAVIALGLGLGGGLTGWRIGRQWQAGQSSERQYELEKRSYLAVMLATAALAIRVFLAPLWFWTLGSLVHEVPGAMCLTGVHMVNPAVGFTATGLKLVVPMAYGYWLLVNAVDRRIETQPLMKYKLGILLPLALLLVVDSACDLRFLTSIQARQVSCCTSLFDAPGRSMAVALPVTMGKSAALLCLAASSLLVGGLTRPRSRASSAVIAALGIIGLPLYVVALHGYLCPVLLHAPFHHCAFCVWQDLWDMRLATFLLLGGLSAATIHGLVALQPVALANASSARLMNTVRKLAALAVALGALIVCVHLVLVSLNAV